MSNRYKKSMIEGCIWRVLTMLLCMIFLCGAALPASASNGGDLVDTFHPTVVLSINGTPYTSGTLTVKNGDSFGLSLSFDIDNDWNSSQLGGDFTYQLPGGFTANTGTVTTSFGSYYISNGTVHVSFSDDFMNNVQDRSVNLSITGTIDAGNIDPTIIIPGADIGEIPIIIEKDYGLSLEKTHGSVTRNPDGSLETDYTITVTALYNDQTNIVIRDWANSSTDGANMWFDWDNVSVSGANVVNKSISGNNYYLTLDKLDAGDSATITYHARYSCSDPTGAQTYDNDVYAESAENAEAHTYDRVSVSNSNVQVSKDGTYNKDTKKIKWTVTIRPNGNAVTIRDFLVGDDLDKLINGSVFIGTSKYSQGSNYTIANLSYEEIQSGYTIPERYKNESYIYVIYETTVTDAYFDAGHMTVKNKVQVDDKEASKEVTVVQDDFTKEAVSYDTSNGYGDVRITWHMTFTFARQLENTVSFSDVLDYSEYHTFVDATASPPGYCTISSDGSRIEFAQGTPAGVYDVYYTSRMNLAEYVEKESWTDIDYVPVANDGTYYINNTVKRLDTNESRYDDVSIPYPFYDKESYKESANNRSKKLEWTITIDQYALPESGNNSIYLYEFVPEGQEFVSLTYFDQSFEPIQYYHETGSESGTVYKFDVTEAVNWYNIYNFKVETRLTDAAYAELFSSSYQKSYYNYARFDIGDDQFPWVAEYQYKQPIKIISKSVGSNLTSDQHAAYTITFNDDVMDVTSFAPEGTVTFTIVDTMGSGLLFLPETLMVETKNSSYGGYSRKTPWTDFTYDSVNNILRINGLQNKIGYRFTYECAFTMFGEKLIENGTNTVAVEGFPEIPQKEVEITNISGVSGSTSSQTAFVIVKQDSETNEMLPNAKFTVYKSDAQKTGASPSGSWTWDGTLTTGESGMTANFNLRYDNVYKIVETDAPDGYRNTADPLYIVRVSKNSSETKADYEAIFGAGNIQVITEADGINIARLVVLNTPMPKTTSVTVKKLVTGNLGDWNKKFSFSVRSDLPLGTPAEGAGYTVNDSTAQFSLQHNESVTITDVVIGSVLQLEEVNGDYDIVSVMSGDTEISASATDGHTYYTFDVESADPVEIVVTNNKEAIPETGIILDSLPYVLILVIAVAAGTVMFLKKRRSDADML